MRSRLKVIFYVHGTGKCRMLDTLFRRLFVLRSAPSLLQFRRDLKMALFQSSYSSP